MKLWLLTLAVAVAIFVGANQVIAQPALRPRVPQVITLSSSNSEGATLTQVIHQRTTIDQVLADLAQLRATTPSLSCASNTAGEYRAVLTFAAGVQTTLTAEKGGCERVLIHGRGHHPGVDPPLLRDFDALFPADWQTGF